VEFEPPVFESHLDWGSCNPICPDCCLFIRSVPLSEDETYFFCRGCGMHYSLDNSLIKQHQHQPFIENQGHPYD